MNLEISSVPSVYVVPEKEMSADRRTLQFIVEQGMTKDLLAVLEPTKVTTTPVLMNDVSCYTSHFLGVPVPFTKVHYSIVLATGTKAQWKQVMRLEDNNPKVSELQYLVNLIHQSDVRFFES